jgi:hypothetical protein
VALPPHPVERQQGGAERRVELRAERVVDGEVLLVRGKLLTLWCPIR